MKRRNDMHAIISEDDNLATVAAELGARLDHFNEARVGPLRSQHVAFTVRDHSGTIIAGLTAEVFWNALCVHLLWVDEEFRRQSYGSSLLRRAENLAIEKSCEFAYLSTFAFQAPAFYARQGYSVIGELLNVPPGSKLQLFSKALPRHGATPISPTSSM
jgi:GNAT superfamily N-acetyltransferase